MLYNKISNWLKDYLESSKLDSFVIGVSGGVDSAVSSTLAAKTGVKTIALSMPIYQGKDQLERANKHIDWLKKNYNNVESIEIDLSNTFESFGLLFSEKDAHALANTRSRLRMVTLYHIAALNNGLVVGTGNKVEDFGIGFYTKYGDGGVDISPIADLMKSEVKEAACELGILLPIIEASPTDGLWDDDRTDEDQIGATYDELEWAMTFGGDKRKLTKRQKEVLKIYYSFNHQNKHKMVPIPICKNEKDA